MVILKYYDDILEAEIDREVLETNGIMAVVLNENTSNVIPLSYAIISLRPHIAVSESNAKAAAEILEFDITDNSTNIKTCPHCGSDKLKFGFSNNNRFGRKFTKIFLIANLLIGGGGRGKILEVFQCEECGKEFKP